MRPADNDTHPNLRASPDLDEGAPKNEKKEFIYSINELTRAGDVTIQPEDLIGVNLVAEDRHGVSKAEVKEENPDGTFKIKFINGNKRSMTYTDLVNAINKKDEEGHKLWTFSEILDHQTIKGKAEIKIKWDTGEATWEPMSEIRKSDPVTIARYSKDNELTEKPGWKWTNRFTKNKKKFLRLSRQMASSKRNTPRYKFGVRVPRTVKEALE